MTERDLRPSRRSVLTSCTSALIAGACARPTGRLSSPTPLEGRVTYSESVQTSGASSDGSTIFSIRLCQYPDVGVAWVWASLLTPDGHFMFADNEVAWSGTPAHSAEAPDAVYQSAADGMYIRFARKGRHGAIIDGRLEFNRKGHRAFSVEAAFVPSIGFEGLLHGRAEIFGQVRARIVADGRRCDFIGPGQWHEQPQMEPRFIVPFVYASLWGEAVSGTLLQSPQGSGGYALRHGSTPMIFPEVTFSPLSAPGRIVNIYSTDGIQQKIELERLLVYTLPVYGKTWTGSFVRGGFLGDSVIGSVNNWLI